MKLLYEETAVANSCFMNCSVVGVDFETRNCWHCSVGYVLLSVYCTTWADGCYFIWFRDLSH